MVKQAALVPKSFCMRQHHGSLAASIVIGSGFASISQDGFGVLVLVNSFALLRRFVAGTSNKRGGGSCTNEAEYFAPIQICGVVESPC